MGCIWGYLLYKTNFAWTEPGQDCKVGAICHPDLPPLLPLPFKSLSGTFSIAFRVIPDFDFHLIAKPKFSRIHCVHLYVLPEVRLLIVLVTWMVCTIS